MASQNQYNVLRQPTRNLNIKIDLINESDIIVGSFDGIVTDGNINLDGDSTYRRSGNMTMIFDKKYNLLPSPESRIWFNKRVGITIYLTDYFGNVIPFNMGRFAINDVDLNLGSAEKTISLNLSDYMTFLDGSLSGELSHQVIIEEGTPINDAIKYSLQGLGRVSIEDMNINGSDLVLPYTIEKESGTTVYTLIKEIIDLFMGFDFYYNEDGVLVVEKIRNRKNDPVIEVFDGTNKDLSITSSSKTDFNHTRNAVYVWGRQLDDGTQIKWFYRNRWARNNVSDLDSLIDRKTGDICHIVNDDSSYMWDGTDWQLLDFTVVPKFNIEQIGEKALSVREDDIFTETQASLRCEYELGQVSNMAESINISTVPNYILKPNHQIEVNKDNIIKGKYLISSVSVPLNLSSSMSIQAEKLYF